MELRKNDALHDDSDLSAFDEGDELVDKALTVERGREAGRRREELAASRRRHWELDMALKYGKIPLR